MPKNNIYRARVEVQVIDGYLGIKRLPTLGWYSEEFHAEFPYELEDKINDYIKNHVLKGGISINIGKDVFRIIPPGNIKDIQVIYGEEYRGRVA